MNSVTRKTKLKIFQVLQKETDAFTSLFQRDQFMNFLSEIWDLENMRSTDSRFQDAAGDIYQHMVNNDDWDYDYLFKERLKLFNDNEKFNQFVETIVSPGYREDENEIFLYIQFIAPHLEADGLTLRISEYNEEGLPIYKIRQYKKDHDLPNDVIANEIPFIVTQEKYGRLLLSGNSLPKNLPCFILVFNSGWNDYTFRTSFGLYYVSKNKDIIYIGPVKLTSNFDEEIINALPEQFKALDENYCSLGQEEDYYINLKDIFGKDYLGILFALRDAAFFENVHDKFEKDKVFNTSLIRYDETERLLREAKFLVHDFNIEDLYNFKYLFKPKYSADEIEVNFDFDVKNDFPSRINALIGKNGTGKTQLITSLPIDIYKKNEDNFLPITPRFSKVIAVSYSIFDRFEIPNKSAEFNYIYCGLRKEDGENYSEKGLVLRFHNTWKKISELQRMSEWKSILENFIEEEILDEFIVEIEDSDKLTVDTLKFNQIRPMLSSGQSILLYILSEIIANIKYDTLLLYDEPETHLHPNAITQLVSTIYQLVEEFKSYCIIATHSPLIVRELPAKSVFVMERNYDVCSIRKIGIESFGENLTTITEEIFGNRSVSKQYKKIIDELVDEFNSYEEVISKIESNNIPLSLNAKLYIKSIAEE